MVKNSVLDKLPKNNQYVLIHLTITNWGDNDDPHGNRYWRVAKFVKGISEEDRLKMKSGDTDDPAETWYTCPTPPGDWIEHKSKRSSVYKSGDVCGNNLVPYKWDEFGPSSHFGQDVDYWCELPELNN